MVNGTPGVTVCAVAPAGVDLSAQTRAPDAVVAIPMDRTALSQAVAAAAGAGDATWLWLLDAGVDPAPDALQELLEPLGELAALGDPPLLAGKVTGGDGHLDRSLPPWPRLLAREVAITGAEHRLAALRAARYGSLLVDRRAVQRHGPPRVDFAGAGDDLEWTGRILRDDPGFLVPRSVAVRRCDPATDAAAFTRNRVRILRGEGWQGQEKAWFAFLLAQDTAGALVARPARLAGLLGAVVAGLRAPV